MSGIEITPKPENSSVPRLRRAVIPMPGSRLGVLDIVVEPNHGTDEDQLLRVGKKAIGEALTPDYGLKDTYITDPIGRQEQSTAEFIRSIHDDDYTWLARRPDVGEKIFVIHDLDLPALEIVPLDSAE